MTEIKPQINHEDFDKIDIRVGSIEEVEEIPGSEKLLKLVVDFGEVGKKQILSGIKKWYSAEDLKNQQACFVLNLEPRKMMGLESQGMILALDRGADDRPVLIVPREDTTPGFSVR